jgi:hypothetical protein
VLHEYLKIKWGPFSFPGGSCPSLTGLESLATIFTQIMKICLETLSISDIGHALGIAKIITGTHC